ncbi:MAG: prepilin-type N-terminal cleavage/methylation domain-containing protein [Planctomycetota bacterium]
MTRSDRSSRAAAAPCLARAPKAGFTILEIMIAVAILVIGLLGILALFPVAIHTGKLTIQDTNAVLIAQSVEQAIREGLQHRKGQTKDGKWTFFLFQHDGVDDPLPRFVSDARPSADHYILLPTRDLDGSRSAINRDRYYRESKLFVYPETDGKTWEVVEGGLERTYEDLDSGADPNGSGSPLRADNDGDDRAITRSDGEEEETFDVYDVFRLSNRFFDPILAEEEDLRDLDPISQYSFAFAIRPAFNDASLGQHMPRDKQIVPAGELFEVEIMVFRSFRKGTTNADPIYRTTILVHK